MNENVKFIVTKINKLMGWNYNLIGFNALNAEDLLQVLYINTLQTTNRLLRHSHIQSNVQCKFFPQILCNVLMKIQQQDNSDTTARLDSPEENSIYILTTLRMLNYQPDVDPTAFRYTLCKDVKNKIFIFYPLS